jgi:hypothetical protein
LRVFSHITEWRDYLLSLQIQSTSVPLVHVEAFHAALRLMLLAWIEPVAIKAAELQALRSLECALVGVYKQPLKKHDPKSRAHFSDLIEFAVECDGLSETHILKRTSKGEVLSVVEKGIQWRYAESTLLAIRNALAHGDLLQGSPWRGLFEAVREVMEHAYRNSGIDTSTMPIDCPAPPLGFELL